MQLQLRHQWYKLLWQPAKQPRAKTYLRDQSSLSTTGHVAREMSWSILPTTAFFWWVWCISISRQTTLASPPSHIGRRQGKINMPDIALCNNDLKLECQPALLKLAFTPWLMTGNYHKCCFHFAGAAHWYRELATDSTHPRMHSRDFQREKTNNISA